MDDPKNTNPNSEVEAGCSSSCVESFRKSKSIYSSLYFWGIVYWMIGFPILAIASLLSGTSTTSIAIFNLGFVFIGLLLVSYSIRIVHCPSCSKNLYFGAKRCCDNCGAFFESINIEGNYGGGIFDAEFCTHCDRHVNGLAKRDSYQYFIPSRLDQLIFCTFCGVQIGCPSDVKKRDKYFLKKINWLVIAICVGASIEILSII